MEQMNKSECDMMYRLCTEELRMCKSKQNKEYIDFRFYSEKYVMMNFVQDSFLIRHV